MKTLLLGDLSPTKTTVSSFQSKDMETLFTDTVQLFENNDINFINLECAITDCDADIPKIGPALKAPVETADVLKKLGVNCVGVSNNHFFDFGIKGANDSIKALNVAGIPFTGFGENYEDSRKNFVIEKNKAKRHKCTQHHRNCKVAARYGIKTSYKIIIHIGSRATI